MKLYIGRESLYFFLQSVSDNTPHEKVYECICKKCTSAHVNLHKYPTKLLKNHKHFLQIALKILVAEFLTSLEFTRKFS